MVFSPSLLTTTSKDGSSCNALSSQKVTWGPPIAVIQFGQTSLHIFAMRSPDLYVSVVVVIPTMSGWRLLISLLNSSSVNPSTWQSITLISYCFFSKTAAKYPKPNGGKGGC